MFKLLIADDEGKTTVVPLVRDEITIGRKEGNTIRLTERNVSRKHAKLRRSNGAFVLEDLTSYNGVKVNGKKIAAETSLKPGDQILIGDYQLALQLDGDTASATLPEQTAPSAAVAPTEVVTAMISAPAPSMGPPARFVMMSPPAPGAEYALSRERMRIGRAEDLEIWVNHRSISREHAEVVNEGGRLIIKDLASANGLRVNGAETKSHELRPGDVVELGQVRFRFVPAGEAFTFDEGRTIQMDAVSLPTEPAGPNRTAMYAAGAILVLALLGGAIVVFSGGGSDEPTTVALPPTSVVVSVTDPAPVTTTAAPAADPNVLATTAIAACNTALNSGDLDGALARAAEALQYRPGDPAALDCQQRATAERDEGATFAAGLAHMQNGDWAAAYVAFESLPVDSAYRARPEVAETMAHFASDSVTQAEALADSNPTEANRLAASVLVMTGVDPSLTARAEDVERRTRPRGVAHAPIHRPVLVAPPPTTRAVTPPPPTTRVVAPPPTTRAVTPPPTSAPPSSVSAGAEWQRCLAAGDNNCVIDQLRGRAHSAAELRALFGAQRAAGDRAGACTTARQLLTAPGVTAAQQAQIRQYSAAQCQ
ncbi:MAG: FHA domain-containing protein [Sandaracinus sp.]